MNPFKDGAPQFQDEENQEKVEALIEKARATPFANRDEQRAKQKDSLAVVFNLNHLQVDENPVDYGFRGSIPLMTDGVEAEEKRKVRVRKDQPVTIPASLEGIPRGYLKIENRTGRRSGMLAQTVEIGGDDARQIVLLKEAASGNLLGVVRPGGIYFGEPPAGELILCCEAEEAVVSYVIFPYATLQ